MRKRKAYYVAGGHLLKSSLGKFWGVTQNFSKGWSNFIVCYDLYHALRQFNKLPTKYRQIDVREPGKKPYVLKYG